MDEYFRTKKKFQDVADEFAGLTVKAWRGNWWEHRFSLHKTVKDQDGGKYKISWKFDGSKDLYVEKLVDKVIVLKKKQAAIIARGIVEHKTIQTEERVGIQNQKQHTERKEFYCNILVLHRHRAMGGQRVAEALASLRTEFAAEQVEQLLPDEDQMSQQWTAVDEDDESKAKEVKERITKLGIKCQAEGFFRYLPTEDELEVLRLLDDHCPYCQTPFCLWKHLKQPIKDEVRDILHYTEPGKVNQLQIKDMTVKLFVAATSAQRSPGNHLLAVPHCCRKDLMNNDY